MFEGTVSVFNTKSIFSNISYKSFKTQNLPMQNSYCDHRNFDSVNHREEIVQRGDRHLDNLNFCVTRSTQVPRATQNLPASAVAEIS